MLSISKFISSTLLYAILKCKDNNLGPFNSNRAVRKYKAARQQTIETASFEKRGEIIAIKLWEQHDKNEVIK